MSASREKKKRQELLASGTTDPKAARAAQEKAEAHKTNLLYGTLGIIFVVVAVFLLIYNSNFYTRSRTAVTVDGEKYSVAQVSYYYGQAYQNFASSSNGYLMMMYGMLDTSQPLSTQSYPYDSTLTWADYFKNAAVDNIRFIHAAAKAARAEGMALEAEDLETFDANVDSMKSSAETAGKSYASYLKNVYGPNVTVSVFETCLKEQLLASKYAAKYQDSLNFTDEEIQTYYEENKNTYDVVDGGYVSISATPEEKTDEEGNTVEPTAEETAAALAAAKDTAQAILDAYADGGDLSALAEEYGATYTGSAETRYSSGLTGDWLFDEARQSGDTAVLENDGATYVYAIVFNSRSRIEYPSYDVRHILITSDTLDLPEGEEAADEQLQAKAQEILDTWDGTEDGFAELARKWSEDSNAEEGGLYEDVTWGQMVSSFNDWCYEDGRKAGDTGIVESNYGYHVMYFVGYGDEAYWHSACNSMLESDAYNEWYDTMTESVTAEVHESAMSMI